MEVVDAYIDSLGTGFLPFPSVPESVPPNRLRRSLGFRSSEFFFLLVRRTGAASSEPAGLLGSLAVTGVDSLECRLLVSFRELAFSLMDADSAERPNNRLRLAFWSSCVVSLCESSVNTWCFRTILGDLHR